MAKPVRRAADRIHPAGMSGPHHRMESKIVTPHSAKLLCLSPAFPNSSGAGQRCSGIESSGEARTRAHRGDSSGRRTSPSLPAPGGLVRQGRRSWLPALCLGLANQRVPEPRQISSRLRTYELLFALAALRFRTPCSPLRSSLDQLFWQTVIVCGRGFGNDRQVRWVAEDDLLRQIQFTYSLLAA